MIAVASGLGFFAYQQKQNSPVADQTTADNSNNTSLVGNDRDEHGCIGSAGYSWCEPKNKCLRIWEEACYASSEQEIQFLLAKKYNKPSTDITIAATKKTDVYMAGRISFAAAGLPKPPEGGVFLAAKEGNVWTLVYDGNGSINCTDIKQRYDFPKNMLQGFCD